jgi:hypothetical protein
MQAANDAGDLLGLMQCEAEEARVVRSASWMRGAVSVVLLLAVCALFSASANASCNPRSKSPVLVSNWTQFLKEGLSQASAAPTSGTGADPTIVGMWHVFLVSGGQPFDEGYEVWHSDGTEILNDIAPPVPANSAGNVCLGVYKKSGPGTYMLRHIGWFIDENANLVGTGVITETITVDLGGDSFHGTFDFKQLDLSENVVFEATGNVSGKRVTVD